MSARKIDPELKTEWLAALRSGTYTQGRDYLRDVENRFCCLGVALDIVDPEKWHLKRENSKGYDWKTLPTCNVGKDLEEVLGLGDLLSFTLARMNDTGQSFSEIADWIEERL